MAAIGIQTTNAQLHIKTPRPQMTIENIRPEMEVDRKNPEFLIDWSSVHNSRGAARPKALGLQARNKARAKTFEAIGEAARRGDFWGKVEQPGDRVVQYEKNKALEVKQTDINIGLSPPEKPNMKWEPGYIKVKWSRHKLIVEWDKEYLPEMTVDPKHSIEIFLRNKPYIKISVAEDEMPHFSGRVIDESI